jgi:hypothetical protein
MVEVGTYYGSFARRILEGWDGSLTCIDPWVDQSDDEYRDGCANGGVAGGRNLMGPIFEHASRALGSFGKRVRIIQDYSCNARPSFQDQSLDCVYIDGNHRYEIALDDLFGWMEKIKPGGTIGIHDCYVRIDDVQWCGVWDAVCDFSNHLQQRAFLTNCTSAWWIKE